MRRAENCCRCVQYFDGMTTFEEISYRTNLHRRELDSILELFNDDVSDLLILLCHALMGFSARHLSPPMMTKHGSSSCRCRLSRRID